MTLVVNSKAPVGEGFKLSKNADFSTEDSVFNFGDTIYILVWSDRLDFGDMKESRWQLEGAEENFINNFDGTYTSQVVLNDNVKELSPGEEVESDFKIQMEDESGHQLKMDRKVTLGGP